MAKRFTATEKWDKEWFQSLKPKHKCLWQYLCDKCDVAGIWDANFTLATFSIGESVSEADLKVFGDRIIAVQTGKFFLTDFIKFQYGTLSENCKPHIPILKILKKYQIDLIHDRLPKGIHTLKEMDKEKEMEKDKEKENGAKRKFLDLKEKFLNSGSFTSSVQHKYLVDGNDLKVIIEDFFVTKTGTGEYKSILNEDDCQRNLFFYIPHSNHYKKIKGINANNPSNRTGTKVLANGKRNPNQL